MKFENITIKFAMSYFYRIRFFPKNYVPISICIWDPKWYAEKGLLRAIPYVPKDYNHDTDCESCAVRDQQKVDNLHCRYLEAYRKQLSGLNFDELNQRLIKFVDNYVGGLANIAENNEVFFIFIGHEVPAVECTERNILAEWFRNNGEECNELRVENGIIV